MGQVLKYRRRRDRTFRAVSSRSSSGITLELANSLDRYAHWTPPTVIIADGPYGLSKFPGDPNTANDLGEWYAPHIAAWSQHSLPETTLWFWCSELGWAEVHPVLKMHGWKYRAAHIWDKGIGHVAGNCNGDSIRGFPVVSEICVQYVRDVRLPGSNGEDLPLKGWLRQEWLRSGLPLNKTNEACGVKNAATRKYFTQCHLWYFPPAEKMVELADYATRYGKDTDRPYFSLDGKTPLTEEAWARLRAKWNHVHGITNVWSEPAIRGEERIRVNGLKALHANQKPLSLMRRIIDAASDPGDVVWEPFGGLCSAALAAIELQRSAFAAEVNADFYDVACKRFRESSLVSVRRTNGRKTASPRSN